MWFCIPFTLATTMGLSALALDLPITLEEAGAGAWPCTVGGLSGVILADSGSDIVPSPWAARTGCSHVGACRAGVPLPTL